MGVGVSPDAAAYDPYNGLVYVTNQNDSTSGVQLGPSSVSVLNGTANIATLPVSGSPEPPLVDTMTGLVYVPNYSTDNVTVINGTAVVTALSVGHGPGWGAFDPADGDVYVADSNGSEVSVIQGSTLVATIPVGADPSAITYDPADGDMYVSNEGSANVSVLNGTALVGTVATGGYPFVSAFDGGNGYVYVPIAYGNVSVIQGTTLVTTVVVGAPFTADTVYATYDPSNDYVYVADDPGSVSVINGTTVLATVPVEPAPNQPVYDPANGEIFVVSPFPSSVDVINGTQVVATVSVGMAPQASTFDGGDESLYVVNQWSNSVSVVRLAPAYPVTFQESGLPPGTNWSVDLAESHNYSMTDSVGFFSANGTFDFYVPPLLNYTPTPATGSVLVNGSPATVRVAWEPVQYLVTFAEGGLPLGTLWNVTLNGTLETSTSNYLEFAEPDGTYTYSVGSVAGYAAKPSSGEIPVSGGAATVTVTFSIAASTGPPPPRFNVTFSESGLPHGTEWSVTFNGTLTTGTGNLTVVGFENGTFPFSVGSIAGLAPDPAQGSVVVHGAPASEGIAFSAPTSPVPNGTSGRGSSDGPRSPGYAGVRPPGHHRVPGCGARRRHTYGAEPATSAPGAT